jgi:hypothetical protein
MREKAEERQKKGKRSVNDKRKKVEGIEKD